ncbi:hypothetical protein HYV49_00275 [Candidatus Pacearchaeota archaeon]|nr:hypothetical protein [Candidatus Pacearchaeota archaeon]
MKVKFIRKELWNNLNKSDGSISLFDEIPIPALQNPKLKKKVINVATSGGNLQPNPGIDIYRDDNGQIDKDWYSVREHDEANMQIIGPIKDEEHHLGKIPNRVLKEGKKNENNT